MFLVHAARSPEIIDCQLDAEEELEFGLQRLRDGWTWKVWTLYDETEFDDIEDFRQVFCFQTHNYLRLGTNMNHVQRLLEGITLSL